MAIDFGGALTTDNYSTGVLPKLNGTDTALAQMLDPSYVTYTGTPPTGAKRLNGGLFQQYASGAWSNISMGYVLKAGDTGLSGAQVWSTSGQAAPAFTTRSAGAKVVLYPAIGASSADYAIGVTSSSQWYGVPTSTQSHQWYAGTTLLATLSGGGVLNAVGGLQVNGANVWHSGNLTPSNYAPIANPTFTGAPAAPTPATSDNSTKLATTAYVKSNLGSYAPLASPAMTGTPTAPTAATNTSNTQIATTAFANPGAAGSTNGYQRMPSGIIFQWGEVYVGDPGSNSGATGTWTFPIAFPNGCLSVVATLIDTSGQGAVAVTFTGGPSASSVGFRVQEWSGLAQNVTIKFIAVGI